MLSALFSIVTFHSFTRDCSSSPSSSFFLNYFYTYYIYIYSDQIVITIRNFVFSKKLREEKKGKHIYLCRVCYTNLPIYHYWFSSLFPMDSSHLMQRNFLTPIQLFSLLPPLCSYYCQMHYFSNCYRPNNIIILQASPIDIAGWIPGHHNKANITTSESHEFFSFQVHKEVMFALYCSLLRVQ